MKKRIFSLLMVVCMLASLLPAGVLTASAAGVTSKTVRFYSDAGVRQDLTANVGEPIYATFDDTGVMTTTKDNPLDNYVKLEIVDGVATLFMHNVYIKGHNASYGLVYSDTADLRIVVTGDSTLESSDYGICWKKNLSIAGPGKLTLIAPKNVLYNYAATDELIIEATANVEVQRPDASTLLAVGGDTAGIIKVMGNLTINGGRQNALKAKSLTLESGSVTINPKSNASTTAYFATITDLIVNGGAFVLNATTYSMTYGITGTNITVNGGILQSKETGRFINISGNLNINGGKLVADESASVSNITLVTAKAINFNGGEVILSCGQDAYLTSCDVALPENGSFVAQTGSKRDGTDAANLGDMVTTIAKNQANSYIYFMLPKNKFTQTPSIEDYLVGQNPAPQGAAKYGTVEFWYADANGGDYSMVAPTTAGVYNMKAIVPEGSLEVKGKDLTYAAIESEPVAFEVLAAPHVCEFETKYDKNGHWGACECGETTEVEAHDFVDDHNCLTGHSCECGYEIAAQEAHSYTNENDATCNNEGCAYNREIVVLPPAGNAPAAPEVVIPNVQSATVRFNNKAAESQTVTVNGNEVAYLTFAEDGTVTEHNEQPADNYAKLAVVDGVPTLYLHNVTINGASGSAGVIIPDNVARIVVTGDSSVTADEGSAIYTAGGVNLSIAGPGKLTLTAPSTAMYTFNVAAGPFGSYTFEKSANVVSNGKIYQYRGDIVVEGTVTVNVATTGIESKNLTVKNGSLTVSPTAAGTHITTTTITLESGSLSVIPTGNSYPTDGSGVYSISSNTVNLNGGSLRIEKGGRCIVVGTSGASTVTVTGGSHYIETLGYVAGIKAIVGTLNVTAGEITVVSKDAAVITSNAVTLPAGVNGTDFVAKATTNANGTDAALVEGSTVAADNKYFYFAMPKNEFITAPSIENWDETEAPKAPVGEAKYGEPVYFYAPAGGTYSAAVPTKAGDYYVIAVVAGGSVVVEGTELYYDQIVSDPVAFKITHTCSFEQNHDDTHHWNECSCGAIVDKEEHIAAGDGSCLTADRCECGYEVPAQQEHVYTNEYDATCNNSGCTAGNRVINPVMPDIVAPEAGAPEQVEKQAATVYLNASVVADDNTGVVTFNSADVVLSITPDSPVAYVGSADDTVMFTYGADGTPTLYLKGAALNAAAGFSAIYAACDLNVVVLEDSTIETDGFGILVAGEGNVLTLAGPAQLTVTSSGRAIYTADNADLVVEADANLVFDISAGSALSAGYITVDQVTKAILPVGNGNLTIKGNVTVNGGGYYAVLASQTLTMEGGNLTVNGETRGVLVLSNSLIVNSGNLTVVPYDHSVAASISANTITLNGGSVKTSLGRSIITGNDIGGEKHKIIITINGGKHEFKDAYGVASVSAIEVGSDSVITINGGEVTITGGGGTLVTVPVILPAEGDYIAMAGTNASDAVAITGTFDGKGQYFYFNKPVNEFTEAPSIDGWNAGEEASKPTGAAKYGNLVFYYAVPGGTYTTEVPTEAGDYYMIALVAGGLTEVQGTEMVYAQIMSEPVAFSIVNAHTCDFETKYDDTHHWQACTGCSNEINKAEHSFSWAVTTPATCTEAGVETGTCACGKTTTREIPVNEHDVAEEWTSDDTHHWHTCSGCTNEFDKAEHSYDDIFDAKCDCGYERVAADVVAKIGDERFASLAAAFATAQPGQTITLQMDIEADGLVINKDIIIDLGGHTYTINGPVGSAGTVNNGLQILKGYNVTLKNGTLTSSVAKLLVQNYANLTLDDIVLDGTKLQGDGFVLSLNNGTNVITGNTQILAAEGNIAIDVCYWPYYSNGAATGYNGVQLTIDSEWTGSVTGIINLSDYTYDYEEISANLGEKCQLVIESNAAHRTGFANVSAINLGNGLIQVSGAPNGIFITGNTTVTSGEFGKVYGDGSYCFFVQNNGVLTIEDGEFESTNCTVVQAGSTVGNPGHVVINGGTFKAVAYNGDHRYTINLKDNTGSSAVISGGKFYKFDPDCNKAEYPTVSFAGEGYIAIPDGDYYVVKQGSYVAEVNGEKFDSLQAAIEAAQDGDTIVLQSDIVTDGTFTIADGINITLNMNGKKITATDKKGAKTCYEIFYIYGGMVVTGNGTIELTAETNRGWDAYSSIFHNRGGILVIENGTFTHKGGSDMAYVVDNSGNSYGDATTTINDGTLTSAYIGIRNRMDTYGANGGGNGIAKLIVNGGTISGKYAVWGQVSSTGVKGEIVITNGTLKAWEGKAALLVDEDATSEIKVAVSGGTFTSDVTAFCVEGYHTVQDGEYYVYGAHSFGEWTQTKAPTCTKKGEDARTCACGHSETREVETLEHTWVEVEGDTAKTCSVCGKFDGLHEGVYYEDGKAVPYKGLIEVDGNFYYVGTYGKVIKDKDYYIQTLNGVKYANGTEVTKGTYTFGADGKMLVKNGLFDGVYYEYNKVVPYKGLVKVGSDLYYVGAYGEIIVGRDFYVQTLNGVTYENGSAVAVGTYTFDDQGKMIIRDGLVGTVYYENNKPVPYKGLIKVDGDLYYVGAYGEIIVGRDFYVKTLNGVTYENGSAVAVGTYTFGADGKMVIRDGLVGTVYYENNKPVPYKGLIKVGSDLYYVGAYGEIIVGRDFYVKTLNGVTYDNGSAVAVGTYTFDAQGKMVIRDGLVGNVYYENNQPVPYKGLIEVDGNFYYVGDAGKILANGRYYIKTTNGYEYDGEAIKAGTYTFDADGKMIIN